RIPIRSGIFDVKKRILLRAIVPVAPHRVSGFQSFHSFTYRFVLRSLAHPASIEHVPKLSLLPALPPKQAVGCKAWQLRIAITAGQRALRGQGRKRWRSGRLGRLRVHKPMPESHDLALEEIPRQPR